MSTKVAKDLTKPLYETKAEEFIRAKRGLEKTPSTVPKRAIPAARRGSVVQYLRSLLNKIFNTIKVPPVKTHSENSELAKDLEVCEAISPKMLGLILDDHAIRDTDFEGVKDVSETIDYMGSILAKNKERFSSLGLDADAFIRKFAFPSAIAHDLEVLVKDKKNLTGKEQEEVLQGFQKIAEGVALSVQKLAPGERLLLPGGWSNRVGGGHAILYEVIRDTHGVYSFAIYNTGQGSNYHPGAFHDLKEKHQGYIEIEGVSREKICSVHFYKTLFEVRNFNSVKTEKDQATEGPAEVYRSLLQYLGGKRKTFDAGHLGYRSGQRSGTCAWKSLMEGLRQSCTSYEQYRRLKYLVQCQALVDFSKTLEKTDFQALSVKERHSLCHLLKITSQKIGRSLTKSFDKGWISQKELEEGLRLVDKLKGFYVPVALPTGMVEENSPAKSTALRCEKDFSVRTGESHLNKCLYGDIHGGMPYIPDLTFDNIDALKLEIDSCYKILSDADRTTCIRGLEILTASILKLAVPKKGVQDRWDTLSEDTIRQHTEQLCRLIRLLSCSREELGCSPKLLLCAYHLVAILDKLVKRSPDSKLPKAPVYAGLLQGFKGVGFILPTKALQDYRKEIEDYFESSDEAPEKCLFSFTSREGKRITPFGMFEDFPKGLEPPGESIKNHSYYLYSSKLKSGAD